jgi:hypothetical protein
MNNPARLYARVQLTNFFSLPLQYETEEVEVTHNPSAEHRTELVADAERPKVNTAPVSARSLKPQQTPESKKKKKGLFGGLFGRKKQDGGVTPASTRTTSRYKK